METFDLIVLGAGSGGLAAAKRAAAHGAKVAIVENDKVGGTCVIRGCVPKKLMTYAAATAETIADAAGYGFTLKSSFDFAALANKRNAEIERLNKLHTANLAKANVTLLRGHGMLAGKQQVSVNGKLYQANNIVIATGGAPRKLGFPGAELAITSDGVWELTELPKHITIVGAGYIGVEFASIFNALGSEVTLVYRRDRVLGGFDPFLQNALLSELKQKGVECLQECEVTRLEQTNNCINATFSTGRTAETNCVLIAAGRTPNTKNIGLEKTSVVLGCSGEIKVEVSTLKAAEGIYAIGDVTDLINLTPAAVAQGRRLADNLYSDTFITYSKPLVPSAVFCSPPVATIGLTEDEAAKELGDQVYTLETSFRPMAHVLPDRSERFGVKVVLDKRNDKIIGVHMIGKDSPEILQAAAIAVQMGATLADFNATMALHPSSAEELVLLK